MSHTYEFAAEAGGLRTRVGPAEVSLRACGALWIAAEGALVVADLHLEKGSSYAARGQMLPPYDTAETLTRLEAEVAALSPAVLVFLGDSFHDRRWERRIAGSDLDRVRRLAMGRELVWVVGNHDADSPKALPGRIAVEIVLAGLTLRHEPAAGPAEGEVSGHLHPCAKVAGRGRAVRRRCFVTDAARLVLPAFGAYAGGLNIKDAAFSGLFTRPPLAGALGEGRVHPIGWGSLRGD